MRLSDFFMPLLSFVRSFDEAAADSPQQVSDSIDQLIQQARTRALNAGVDIEMFQAALFPIAAWTDEGIARRKLWDGAMAWQPFLLQRRYFMTSFAGREFFERLETLREEDAAVREVYLLCLCMGFMGRYGAASDGAELSNLRLAQYHKILEAMGMTAEGSDLTLFPSAYRSSSLDKSRRAIHWGRWFKPTTLAIAVIPLLLLVFIAWALTAEIESSVHTFRQSIGL